MSRISSADSADLSRSDPRGQLVDGLRRELGRWGAGATVKETGVFSCGAAAVDRLLPDGGFRHGMLVEWLGAAGGSGAATLGLLGAREACREGGVFVVVDRLRTFYPPAAAAWDIDLDRLIVVHPQNARDELWAAVQALRSPVVAAMWAAMDRLDSRAFRRLQLAAQAGRTLGVLMRPAGARDQPSWADVRLEVGARDWGLGAENNFGFRISDCGLVDLIHNPQSTIRNHSARRVHVRMMRCHSGRAGGSTVLEIDDVAHTVQQMRSTYDAHSLPVVAELADSASRSLPAGA